MTSVSMSIVITKWRERHRGKLASVLAREAVRHDAREGADLVVLAEMVCGLDAGWALEAVGNCPR